MLGGGCAALELQAAERRYPVSKVRSSGGEEIPHVQGQEQWLEEIHHVQGQEQRP